MSVVIIGSYVQDYVWNVSTLPMPGESRIGEFSTGPGGKGSNQAICCRLQGVDTLFIAALGNDSAASGAKARAATLGLEAVWISSEQPTAAASVVVDAQGRNLICVALGANQDLSAEAVRGALSEEKLPEHVEVVLTQLETNLGASVEAMRLARTHGAIGVLNPAPINPLVGRELLESADIITPNETEFAFLMRHVLCIELPENWWLGLDAELHGWCRQLTSATVVITLGADGAFVSHGDSQLSGKFKDARPFYRVKALDAKAIDTTGAGDAFNAGLAAGLVKFAGDFSAALQYATQVAGLSVERPGAALSMPTAEEVARRWA